MWYTFQIFFLIEDFAIQGIQACGTRAEQRVLSIPRDQSGHSLTGDEIDYKLAAWQVMKYIGSLSLRWQNKL